MPGWVWPAANPSAAAATKNPAPSSDDKTHTRSRFVGVAAGCLLSAHVGARARSLATAFWCVSATHVAGAHALILRHGDDVDNAAPGFNRRLFYFSIRIAPSLPLAGSAGATSKQRARQDRVKPVLSASSRSVCCVVFFCSCVF